MFGVALCIYDENEETCEKDNWFIADEFGDYKTRKEAEEVAAQLACTYHGFIGFYCKTHDCDGVSFHVVNWDSEQAVTAYDLTAAGQVTEWRDTECHEWRLV